MTHLVLSIGSTYQTQRKTKNRKRNRIKKWGKSKQEMGKIETRNGDSPSDVGCVTFQSPARRHLASLPSSGSRRRRSFRTRRSPQNCLAILLTQKLPLDVEALTASLDLPLAAAASPLS
jgi:cytochrome c556